MPMRVLTVSHLTDDAQEREEFYCPLLSGAGMAHALRIEVCGKRTLRVTGFSASRVKLWEGVLEVKEVPHETM